MKNLGIILFSVISGAIGQIILKVGANKLGELPFNFNTIYKDIIRIITVPEIILGIIFFSISFILWIKVLTKNELSYSYPMVSLNYVIIIIMSYFLFNEELSLKKIIGIGLIVLGVCIIYV
ncbi:SMR family transporter [Defluviitalea phaphyphila]|uniref:SMR family transporter n=1 Tax=Defluviitalea phaphyphila TaxID=1473580 RepID=UPI00072FFF86|nr:SMR family transporter [Defluviitalea phaphyphila]